MIELPDFRPLTISQSSRAPTRAAFEALDHVAVVVAADARAGVLRGLPQARTLEQLLTRARKRDSKRLGSRLQNARLTGITVSVCAAATPFDCLTFSRELLAEVLRE